MDYEFTVIPEAMPLPPRLPWWRRWGLKLVRRPLPAAPQPPGTRPIMFKTKNPDGSTTTMFYPAARIQPQPRISVKCPDVSSKLW